MAWLVLVLAGGLEAVWAVALGEAPEMSSTAVGFTIVPPAIAADPNRPASTSRVPSRVTAIPLIAESR